jgi:hypothetical protein
MTSPFPFTVTPDLHTFQFNFGMSADAEGNDGVFAAHTAFISFDLAPGVTLDTAADF